MIAFYIFTALFIAWIWVDYFQRIDIFEKEKLRYLIAAFLFGTISVVLVYPMHNLFSIIPYSSFNEEIGLSLYYFINVGLSEEIAKIGMFILFYLIFKKQINEPLDYVIYICVIALGFSATENVLYFTNYGAQIISARAIYCSLGHMFDTSIIAYGFIQYLYHPSKPKKIRVVLFIFIAAFLHGFYDFWLDYNNGAYWFVTSVFFLISISLFSTILNNAINNSPSFTYSKGLNKRAISNRLLLLYGIVFILEFIGILFESNLNQALFGFFPKIFLVSIIIIISVKRVARFRVIKGKWLVLKFELPISVKFVGARFVLRMRGISFGEEKVEGYLNQYIYLHELSRRKNKVGKKHYTIIEKKLLLEDDEMYFVAKIMFSGGSEQVLLKPKSTGRTLIKGKYQVVGMFKVDQLGFYDNPSFNEKDFKFAGWAAITK